MSENIINIPGRIRNVAKNGHVAGVEDIYDDELGKTQKEINAEQGSNIAAEVERATGVEELLQIEISGLNSQNYVTVDSYSELPELGSVDTVYRVGSWDGTQIDVTKYAEYAWNSTGIDQGEYKLLSVKTQVGEVFDISDYNSGATYADLAAALDGGNNVPVGIRKGGMSVKFVQTSDNKYVQYRCKTSTWSSTPTDWEKAASVKDVFGKRVTFTNSGSLSPLSEPLVSGDIIVEIGGAYNGVFLSKTNSLTDYIIVSESSLPLTLSDTYNYAAANTGDGSIQTNRVVLESDIVNNLTTDNPYKPLSAKQGKVLKDSLDTNLINNIDNVPTLSSDKLVKSGGVAKQLSVYSVLVSPDYSNDVSELYILDLPNGDVIAKSFQNYAYCYTKGSGVYCKSEKTVSQNNKPYPIKVYQTNDSVNYPIGKVVAYIVLKDFQHFIDNPIGEEYNLVNRSRCENLTNSPIIADYLTYNDRVEELEKQVLPQPYFDESASTFPAEGITSAELMKSFIKSFKMLITRDEDYEYGILKVNNGLPADVDYAYLIQVGKWPKGETRSSSNIISLGYYSKRTNPQSGYININNVAEVEVDWSVLTTPFGSSSYFTGVGTGIQFIQENLFYEEIPYRLEKLESESKDIEQRVEEIEQVVSAENIDICIPDVIDAVVGDTLQLYYKSIFKCVDFSKYDINIICDIGHQYPRYFEVTPILSNIGSHSFTIRIKDNNNNLISEKVVSLNVVNVTSSPVAQTNVLIVGASTEVDGQWPSEFKRRLVGSGGTPTGKELQNITFVGRQSVTYDGKQVNLEATGGYWFKNYISTDTRLHKFFFTAEKPAGNLNVGDVYAFNGHNYTVSEINLSDGIGNISCTGDADVTGAGTLTKVSGTGSESMQFASSRSDGNPFVYGGVIDIEQYAEDYCNGQIDVIYTELFTNSMNAYVDTFPTLFNYMSTFINQFRAVFPNVKFCIGIPWNPDVRGGMGVNYGASGGWSLAYGMKYSFMNLCNALQKYITDNNLGSYVYICNWLNEFDEENDFLQTLKPVNTRSEVTEIFGVNGIHPSIVGYNQMADAAYRLFVAKFCQ